MKSAKQKSIWLGGSGAIAAAALLLVLARNVTGFAEWYALHIFPLFPATLGRLFSLLPFSVAELLLLASPLILFLLLWRRRAKYLFAILTAFLLMFTLACGINYSRASIATHIGIEPRPVEVTELLRLYGILAAQAHELAPKIALDDEGYFTLHEQDMRGEAQRALQNLGQKYPALALYYPRPKPLLLSRGMSWLQLNGIYSPFTVEANYNRDTPLINQPFCLCHELAHLGGYAREDEANFVAYLACLQSDNIDLRYSGLFYALIYVLNALPNAELGQAYEQLPAQIRRDIQQSNAYWRQFEGPVAELSDNINDYYLKANDQTAGVASYGLVVDLLLAYYRD